MGFIEYLLAVVSVLSFLAMLIYDTSLRKKRLHSI